MGCTLLAHVFNFKVTSCFVITAAGPSEANNEHKPQKESAISDNKPKCKCETLMGCVLTIVQFDNNTQRLLEMMANIT